MMDRVVAVKTILASALTGPLAADYRERFFRTLRQAARELRTGLQACPTSQSRVICVSVRSTPFIF